MKNCQPLTLTPPSHSPCIYLLLRLVFSVVEHFKVPILFVLTFILIDIIHIINQLYILYFLESPAFNKICIITLVECQQQLVCLGSQTETQLKDKSAALSIMKVTSGWHDEVISLAHITWNVSVNDRTRKRALIPDHTLESRAFVHVSLV